MLEVEKKARERKKGPQHVTPWLETEGIKSALLLHAPQGRVREKKGDGVDERNLERFFSL